MNKGLRLAVPSRWSKSLIKMEGLLMMMGHSERLIKSIENLNAYPEQITELIDSGILL